MATVYLADDLKHGRKVALKVLKPELAAVVGAERFLAEIKTTERSRGLEGGYWLAPSPASKCDKAPNRLSHQERIRGNQKCIDSCHDTAEGEQGDIERISIFQCITYHHN